MDWRVCLLLNDSAHRRLNFCVIVCCKSQTVTFRWAQFVYGFSGICVHRSHIMLKACRRLPALASTMLKALYHVAMRPCHFPVDASPLEKAFPHFLLGPCELQMGLLIVVPGYRCPTIEFMSLKRYCLLLQLQRMVPWSTQRLALSCAVRWKLGFWSGDRC